jgi:alkylated DNA repair dioxygenase AlkB
LSISENKNLGQMSAGSVSKHSEHKPKLGTTYQQKWLPCSSKDGFSNVRRYQQEMNSPDGVGSGSKQSKCLVNSDSAYKQDFPPLSGHSGSEGLYGGRIQIGQILGGRTADVTTFHHDFSDKLIISGAQSETQLPSQSAKKDEPAPSKGPKSSTGHNNSKHSEHSADVITLHHDCSEKLIISGLQSETQLPSQSAKKVEPAPSKGPKHSEHSADVITLHHDFSEKLIISRQQSETQLPSQSAKKVEPAPSKGPKHSEHSADVITLHHDLSEKLIISILQSETQLPSQSAKKDEPAPSKGPESSTGHNYSKHSEDSVVLPFDICPPKTGTSVALKPGLFEKNSGRRTAIQQSMEGQNGIVLRSGMIHLKGYISLRDQVMIVKSCRDVGLGPGGFYQPGYRDGGKLQLWMTCLGKNWDPEARKYGDNQPFDGAKPPIIPDKFYQLVVKAITDSHSIIQKNSKASNVENILPRMSPDICLVNFYTVNGRLGLHQVCYKPSYTYYSSLSDFLQLLLLEV